MSRKKGKRERKEEKEKRKRENVKCWNVLERVRTCQNVLEAKRKTEREENWVVWRRCLATAAK